LLQEPENLTIRAVRKEEESAFKIRESEPAALRLFG
jgi:hypothetical protein